MFTENVIFSLNFMSQNWQLCFCDLYFYVVIVLSIFQKPQLWRLVLFRHKPKCGNKQQLYCSLACMHCGVFVSHGIETCTAPVQFFREREACTEKGFYLHHHLDKHFLNVIQFFNSLKWRCGIYENMPGLPRWLSEKTADHKPYFFNAGWAKNCTHKREQQIQQFSILLRQNASRA